MSKLSRKFMISLSAIMAVIAAVSLYLNGNVIGRYFLYQEKRELNRVCDLLLSGEGEMERRIAVAEAAEEVVIARVKASEDNDLLNERLRAAFLDKGIGLRKYWLWEEDQQETLREGRRMRIYYQDKLHYSLLVEYMSHGEDFLAVARIVPAVSRTIALVNRVTAAVFTGAVLVMLFLISFLVRRITAPLKVIGETADSIAALDFRHAEIHTGDELEELAADINHMSDRLRENKGELERKNRQMEDLLANVSHDLKTPVALIKAYACGIRDGLDDGTFPDTVVGQCERMEGMIERLLSLAKMKRAEAAAGPVPISRLLEKMIREYRLEADRRGLALDCRIEREGTTGQEISVMASPEAIDAILSNLLSNAVKYAAGGTIRVLLRQQGTGCLLQIENQTEGNGAEESGSGFDPERVWEPFYVAEKSRNKEKSGTGLGLAIVKAAAGHYGFSCGCRELGGRRIQFWVQF